MQKLPILNQMSMSIPDARDHMSFPRLHHGTGTFFIVIVAITDYKHILGRVEHLGELAVGGDGEAVGFFGGAGGGFDGGVAVGLCCDTSSRVIGDGAGTEKGEGGGGMVDVDEEGESESA